MRRGFLIGLFLAVFALDFLTKSWVVHNLPLIQLYKGFPFGGIGVLDASLLKISIVHTTNTGVAWGLLSDYSTLLLILRVGLTVALMGYLFYFKPKMKRAVALTLIAAGAFGNIFDMFFYGHVVDMIYCIFYRYSYPIFNVADSAIFCAAFYLAFESFGKKRAGGRVSSH